MLNGIGRNLFPVFFAKRASVLPMLNGIGRNLNFNFERVHDRVLPMLNGIGRNQITRIVITNASFCLCQTA